MIERLRSAVVDEGLSAGEAAARLGISRNAVIGKCRRMGFALPGAEEKQARLSIARVRAARAPAERVAPPPRPPVPAREPEPVMIEVAPNNQYPRYVFVGGGRASANVTPTARPWADRRHGECKWLVTEGADGLACCAPVQRGGYCREHAERAFVREPRRA
jgi:hypothetical protein